MVELQKIRLSSGTECPYLPDRIFRQEYFFALHLEPGEWGQKLRQGWRRFGHYFFRPRCTGCQACEPIRLPVAELALSKSQKRILRRHRAVDFRVTPGLYRPEYFDLYRRHKESQFGEVLQEPLPDTEGPVQEDFSGAREEEEDEQDFAESFFRPGAPALVTEYRVEGNLAAFGLCDVADDGLSSVYFVFDPRYRHLSLGYYSILRESELCRSFGLSYYYLGYYVRENRHMAYKGRFLPREILDWDSGEWKREEQ